MQSTVWRMLQYMSAGRQSATYCVVNAAIHVCGANLIDAVDANGMHSCAWGNFAHQVPVYHEGQSAWKLTSGHRLRPLLQQLACGCQLSEDLVAVPEHSMLGFVLEGNR